MSWSKHWAEIRNMHHASITMLKSHFSLWKGTDIFKILWSKDREQKIMHSINICFSSTVKCFILHSLVDIMKHFFRQWNTLFSSENSHNQGIKQLKIVLRKFFSEQKNNWQIYSSSMKTWRCKTVQLSMGYLINCKLGCIITF